MDNQLYQTAISFKINGNIKKIKPYGDGLINKTFLISTDQKDYILQKINEFVFNDPYKIMENVHFVTNYIINKGSNSLEIIKTVDNDLVLKNNYGFFRCYKMIKNTSSYNQLINKKHALKVGKIMSLFQYNLVDCNIELVHNLIPNFHNIKYRYYELINILRITKNKNRIKKVLNYLPYLLNEYESVIEIQNYIDQNQIPLRICHYDTKLNNFLFSNENKDCLIDLDTVMKGCSLYDYGDCARNIIVNIKEDEINKEIYIDKVVFTYLTMGYLSVGKNYLITKEILHLVKSIEVITFELSIRFLIDYLNDDCYFKIDYKEQNFNRFLCQLSIYRKLKKEHDDLVNLSMLIYKRLEN